jgi:hypothetical protein
MICKQIELLPPEPVVKKLLLSDILHGNVVRIKKSKAIVMRLKITSFLLNSTIVADVLNRGDCFVCNLQTGTAYPTSGSVEVERLDTLMSYAPIVIVD